MLPAQRLGPRASTSTAASPAIVDNYEHLSFNVGPTLLSWLERAPRPTSTSACSTADRAGGGAIAQAYNHMILPLANERDVRTQIRWGLADFEHRFGRDAPGMWLPPTTAAGAATDGMWLPETAVNPFVLQVLAEEGEPAE